MEEINLKELFDYFKSKLKWVMITVFAFMIIGNIYTIATRVPMYKSDTTIVLVSENDKEYNTNELQLNKNLVGTYSEIIKSRKVLEPVIENLRLKYTYAELKSNVTVTSVANTEIIRITVNDKKAEKATRIANEIAEVFTKEVQKIYKLNNVSVVDKAVKNIKPYNVNYVKDNIIYIALGLIISCGIIFIKFYFDTTIKTSEEIENKLGLTVLGVVPKVERE